MIYFLIHAFMDTQEFQNLMVTKFAGLETDTQEFQNLMVTKFTDLETDTQEFQNLMVTKFTDLEGKFDAFEKKVDVRFDGIDSRFDSMDARFDDLTAEVRGESQATRTLLNQSFDRLTDAVSLEIRVQRIEAQVFPEKYSRA